MQFPNNFEHYLQHMLKYGGGVLPNTPTEELENVLFWTFIKSVRLQYAMDFLKSGHFVFRGVISYCDRMSRRF